MFILNTYFRSLRQKKLQLTSSVEVLKSLLDTRAHRLLTLPDPNTGIKELLVRLIGAIGVTNSSQQVILLLKDVVAHTRQVSELHISVDIDFDDAVADSFLVLGLGGAGAAVKDKEDGLVGRRVELLLDVFLVFGEQFWVQAHVAGLVDAVHVAEASGDGEVRTDRGEGVVDGEDVLGLGVEGVVVDVFVVDAVFFTAGDTDFLHLLALVNKPGRKGKRLPSRATASWEQRVSSTWQ